MTASGTLPVPVMTDDRISARVLSREMQVYHLSDRFQPGWAVSDRPGDSVLIISCEWMDETSAIWRRIRGRGAVPEQDICPASFRGKWLGGRSIQFIANLTREREPFGKGSN